jgi:hypothetical protein
MGDMTTEEIDRRLAERGVNYDLDTGRFWVGTRRLDPQEVRDLLPGLPNEDIERYMDAKCEECDRQTWSNTLKAYGYDPDGPATNDP